jgi:hypothetical protein
MENISPLGFDTSPSQQIPSGYRASSMVSWTEDLKPKEFSSEVHSTTDGSLGL